MLANKKKILIVEDDKPLLEALKKKLTLNKFNVIEAINGEDGLNKALAEHPDLILLDIIMPRMDGLTMLKKLREDKWGEGVPVIMLTNLSDSIEVAEATASGVHDYLVKSDWKMEDVVGKVKEKLGL
jgi:DNA-binding response OmpR family regulator